MALMPRRPTVHAQPANHDVYPHELDVNTVNSMDIAMRQTTSDSLAVLNSLQGPQALSIIRITDAIAAQDASHEDNGTARSSDVSADNYAFDDTSPASLRSELEHYKELFSKLRFSYLEQVTKEKFLRAITAESPLYIEPAENVALEAKLLEEKERLKKQKAEIAQMSEELESRGKEIARRYERVQLQRTRLETLPNSIQNLEETIARLNAEQPPSQTFTDPLLNLTLPDTLAALSERETELAALNAQLATLQRDLPRKVREVERLESELGPMEGQKDVVTSAAREAMKRREEGGIDEMELGGRWYAGSEKALREMLEV